MAGKLENIINSKLQNSSCELPARRQTWAEVDLETLNEIYKRRFIASHQ
jgi:hypothetical protein